VGRENTLQRFPKHFGYVDQPWRQSHDTAIATQGRLTRPGRPANLPREEHSHE
jgi:hypothetical protein